MPTILVVDDEPVILKLCVNVMKLGHHDTLEAANGYDALRLLQDRPADLALLDVMMPGMNGVELAAEIQRHYRNTKIVLMTGFSKREIMGITGKENPYRVVWKPFKAESLLRMIDHVLDESGPANAQPACA